MHEATHAAAETGFDASILSSQNIFHTQVGLYGGMVGILFVIGAFIFLPILFAIERAKDAIVIRFVQLPMPVRRMLYAQSVSRARNLKRNYINSEEEDEDDDDDPDEMDGGDAMPVGEGGTEADVLAGKLRGINVDEDADDIDWAAMMREINNTKNNASAASLKAAASKRRLNTSNRSVSGGGGGSGALVSPGGPSSGSSTPTNGGGSGGTRRPSNAGLIPGGATATLAAARKDAAKGYRKSNRSFFSLMGKFIGPLLALIMFFTIIFVSSVTVLEQTVVSASIGTAASQRSSCTRESVMDIRRMLMAYADRPFMKNQFWLVDDTLVRSQRGRQAASIHVCGSVAAGVRVPVRLHVCACADAFPSGHPCPPRDLQDCITYHMKLLAYGVPPTGHVSRGNYVQYLPIVETGSNAYYPADVNDRVYTALFSDACPFIATAQEFPAFTMERCRAFGGGVLKQGLQVALDEFITRIRRLMDRRIRSRISTGTEGALVGWTIPTTAYNRTEDQCDPVLGCLTALSFVGEGHLAPPPLIDHTWGGDVPANWSAADGAPPGITPFTMQDVATSDDYRWVIEADSLYITPAMRFIEKTYAEQTIININSFISFLQIFISAYMVGFLLFMLVAFLPAVKSTNADIQTKRGSESRRPRRQQGSHAVGRVFMRGARCACVWVCFAAAAVALSMSPLAAELSWSPLSPCLLSHPLPHLPSPPVPVPRPAVLLFLPPDVVRHDRNIRSLIQEILSSETDGLRGNIAMDPTASGLGRGGRGARLPGPAESVAVPADEATLGLGNGTPGVGSPTGSVSAPPGGGGGGGKGGRPGLEI